eukprot:scaffold378_cov131-Skeletonema_menzelii.AAC.4
MKFSSLILLVLATLASVSAQDAAKATKTTDAKAEKAAKAEKTESAKSVKAKSAKTKSDGDVCTIDSFVGTYFYTGGCGGMSFEYSITCDADELCKFEEKSQNDECGFHSYKFNPLHYVRKESEGCTLGVPALPLAPRDVNESCAKLHPNLSIKLIAKEGQGTPATEVDINFSDTYGEIFREFPLKAFNQSSNRVRMLRLQSGKSPLIAFHEESQRGWVGCAVNTSPSPSP